MELRQLRYFVRVVEAGSFSRAAADLEMVQSALSQQIARLEGELSARLLRRLSTGVVPTEAGLAFFREAQLTLRHAEQAGRAAHSAHLTGTVSVGLAPTTASVLAVPLLMAMQERYPDVRLHLVESLSGHLAQMLNARQLDLAVLYGAHQGRRWNRHPLLDERLFLIQSSRHRARAPLPPSVKLADLKKIPLILPTGAHGLRATLDDAFAQARVKPQITGEIDSLAILMDAVDAGLGATVQPWAATRRYPDAADRFQLAEIEDIDVRRINTLCSLSNDELTPAALAARAVLSQCVQELLDSGIWIGARLCQREASPRAYARRPDAMPVTSPGS